VANWLRRRARIKPVGYTEVSGACTHPEYHGRGHALLLITPAVQQIAKPGDVLFLHAFASNTVAIKLYGSIRFVMQTAMTAWCGDAFLLSELPFCRLASRLRMPCHSRWLILRSSHDRNSQSHRPYRER
jgi:hypothetical protein